MTCSTMPATNKSQPTTKFYTISRTSSLWRGNTHDQSIPTRFITSVSITNLIAISQDALIKTCRVRWGDIKKKLRSWTSEESKMLWRRNKAFPSLLNIVKALSNSLKLHRNQDILQCLDNWGSIKVATQSPSTIYAMLLATHSETIDSRKVSKATSRKKAKTLQSLLRRNAKIHFITSKIATPTTISDRKGTYSKQELILPNKNIR